MCIYARIDTRMCLDVDTWIYRVYQTLKVKLRRYIL